MVRVGVACSSTCPLHNLSSLDCYGVVPPLQCLGMLWHTFFVNDGLFEALLAHVVCISLFLPKAPSMYHCHARKVKFPGYALRHRWPSCGKKRLKSQVQQVQRINPTVLHAATLELSGLRPTSHKALITFHRQHSSMIQPQDVHLGTLSRLQQSSRTFLPQAESLLDECAQESTKDLFLKTCRLHCPGHPITWPTQLQATRRGT